MNKIFGIFVIKEKKSKNQPEKKNIKDEDEETVEDEIGERQASNNNNMVVEDLTWGVVTW